MNDNDNQDIYVVLENLIQDLFYFVVIEYVDSFYLIFYINRCLLIIKFYIIFGVKNLYICILFQVNNELRKLWQLFIIIVVDLVDRKIEVVTFIKV